MFIFRIFVIFLSFYCSGILTRPDTLDKKKSQEEQFDDIVEETLGIINEFQPDLNASVDEQLASLEVLGQDILTNMMSESVALANPNGPNSQDANEGMVKIAESTAEVMGAVAGYLPEGEQLNVAVTGIAAAASVIPNDAVDNGVTLQVSSFGHEFDPIITIPPDGIPQLSQGRRVLSVVYVRQAENTNGLQPAELVQGFENETPEANHTLFLQSGVLSIQFQMNGSLHSVAPFYQLPIANSSFEKKSVRIETKTICTYWDENETAFSVKGCSKVTEDNVSVTCHSNHTTSFAILLQVTESPNKTSIVHFHVQDVLTKVFCSLSICALSITVAVFLMFESLRKLERNKIHINLCIALLLAQLLFLLAADKTGVKNACRVIAMLLHYLFLSVFGWMLVEGIHLYYKIVKVFGAEKNRLFWYCVIGWGLPVPIVAISAGVRYHYYTSEYSCWLSIQRGLIWAFAGPALLVICVNNALLLTIGHILYRSVNALKSTNSIPGIRTSLKGTLILTPLLGTTWIFGLLALNGATIVLQYLFIICNSLQGFFIFLIYCLFNQEVRTVLKRTIERKQLTSGSTDTGTSFYKVQSVLRKALDKHRLYKGDRDIATVASFKRVWSTEVSKTSPITNCQTNDVTALRGEARVVSCISNNQISDTSVEDLTTEIRESETHLSIGVPGLVL